MKSLTIEFRYRDKRKPEWWIDDLNETITETFKAYERYEKSIL